MNNKIECEIVQDLLIGYSDGVLNSESKKLVDSHISKCESCQKKLAQIKVDYNRYENKENIELDYLKKVRLKSKIKSIILTLILIFLIAFFYYLIKFIKINNLRINAQKLFESNNYYTETTTSSDGRASAIKLYYKDGKYKEVVESYTENGKELVSEKYGVLDKNEIYTIDFRNNVVIVEEGKYAEFINNTLKKNNDIAKLLNVFEQTFTYSINKDTYDIGREYYVFKKNNRNETWIDKETGLTIRNISKNAFKTFFDGTDIIKDMSDIVIDYKYEFGNIKDEDVILPDLSNYEIKYDTTMNDLINEADKTIEKD